jgi:hypothetical protein
MMSHTVSILSDGKIVRRWDISQLKTIKDALEINREDFIDFEEISFKITYIGNDKHDGHRAWVGRIFGAEKRWGLADDTIIAWGPKGIARNFPEYEDRKFLDFVYGNSSYLWI